MPTRPTRLAVLALVLPLLTDAVRLKAAEQAFSEQVEVNVVNLEIFATTGSGQPVTDLKREDFSVLEDGRPVSLTNFFVSDREPRTGPGAPLPAPPTATAPARPPGPPSPPRPEDQRLHLVVLVDDVNTVPEHRNRMLAQLGDFFDRTLEPGDVVMLVRYDGTPQVVRPFTDDRGQLQGDLAKLATLAGDLAKRQSSYQTAVQYLREAIEGAGGADNPAVQGAIETYADAEGHYLLGTLTALDQVVGALAGVPGRKAIVYLSDGIPTVPGEDLFTSLTRRADFTAKAGSSSYLGSRGYDPAARYRAVTAHAARNHVAFYPLSPSGPQVSSERTANYQNSLKFLAEETGGRAILNVAGDVKADFARLTGDFSQYYSLGYTSPRPGDGAQHKVEVRVSRRGVLLRYRQWYKDKPLTELVADRTAAAMIFGLEDNPLGATLSTGVQKEMATGGFFQVPIQVKIPMARLTLLPNGDSRVGHLRLFVVASGNGQTTPVKSSETEIRVPEAKLAGAAGGIAALPDYVHEVRITLKPGQYALGVGIRDDLAASTSYLKGTVTAGK